MSMSRRFRSPSTTNAMVPHEFHFYHFEWSHRNVTHFLFNRNRNAQYTYRCDSWAKLIFFHSSDKSAQPRGIGPFFVTTPKLINYLKTGYLSVCKNETLSQLDSFNRLKVAVNQPVLLHAGLHEIWYHLSFRTICEEKNENLPNMQTLLFIPNKILVEPNIIGGKTTIYHKILFSTLLVFFCPFTALCQYVFTSTLCSACSKTLKIYTGSKWRAGNFMSIDDLRVIFANT